VRLERVEPSAVVVGRGSLVFVEGSCSSTERIARIEVLLGSEPVATTAVRAGSGFQAILAVADSVPRGATDLLVRVVLRSGEVHTAHVGAIEVTDGDSRPLSVRAPVRTDEPLIAICLAAHEPPPRLFARQIASIRAQSHQRFICIVSDDCSSAESWALIERETSEDERFVCFRNSRRLGFYRNFERCLELVPRDAEYVAFADQDDDWHPDKLATLLDALHRSGALLAYSDMNIVSPDGQRIATTHWTERSNNSTELGSLVIVNTVTGAASLFRRELLGDALPFPPDVCHPYHDHWIACVALALGELAYVDRPLYDYVQHDANVSGHAAEDFRSGLLHMLLRFAANPRLRLRNTIAFARTLYLTEVVRRELIGQTLELRLSGRMAPERAAEVRRLACLSSSLRSLAWLLGRSVRDVRGHGETMGFENQLLKGILWRHGQALRARLARVHG
jgi:glycosyltransferase involved in cell wall biosynthesis